MVSRRTTIRESRSAGAGEGRNYDGNKSTFDDTSVSATGPNSDNIVVFAAERTSDARSLSFGQSRRATVACAHWPQSPALFQATGTSFQDATAGGNTKYIYSVKAV